MPAPTTMIEADSVYTAEYVKARLEAAGTCLLALPASGTAPARYKVAWPEIVQSVWDAYHDSTENRPARPSAKAISEMDEVFFTWLPLLGGAVETRRLILLRSLVWPMSGKSVWPWRHLEQRIGLNRETLALRHARGVDRLVTRLNNSDWIEPIGRGLP